MFVICVYLFYIYESITKQFSALNDHLVVLWLLLTTGWRRHKDPNFFFFLILVSLVLVFHWVFMYFFLFFVTINICLDPILDM